MSQKLVTPRQTDSVRQMANAKKITRQQFQQALDDGTVSRFPDKLKAGTAGIIAPKGARIHTLRVKVKLDRPWQEAVTAAGPSMFPSNYNVLKVESQYRPTGTEEIEEELIMVNYPKGDGYYPALAWAKTQGLQPTVPREVFAIGKQHPNLHTELGLDQMYTVATTECTFEDFHGACYVWWVGSGRGANIRWVGLLVHAYSWFVFRKSVIKTKKL